MNALSLQKKFSPLLISVSFIVAMMIIVSCGLANSRYFIKDYEIDSEKTVNIGECLISEEKGLKNDVYGYVKEGSKWELVYGGLVDNKINITYREYYIDRQGTFIKDGFTQHVEYDLSISDIIQYKDIKLQVVTANNTSITFVPINDKPNPSGEG